MDIICPRCKTSKYRNPAVRFMVNVCGHSLCTNCVELQFNRGSGKCEVCKIVLKKSNFRAQMFLSAEVERGVFIRKKILKDLNKTLKDFQSDHDYNDYLEEVETIIYNLSNGIDVEEMNAKVEQHKAENEDAIVKNTTNNGGLSGDEKDGKENEEIMSVKHEINKNSEGEEVQRINDRAVSDISTLSGGVFLYKEFHVDNEGPTPPKAELLHQLGYLQCLYRGSTEAELAGGFSLEVACYKSICSAMTGLYVLEGHDSL